MTLNATALAPTNFIESEKRSFERGFFARAFCEREFGQHPLATRFCRLSNSLSAQKGTLRGMS
jgi:dTDP-4-dehydrorhamnose 3,5-epimerase